MPIFATNAGSFSPLSIKSIHAAGSGAVADYLIENSLRFDSNTPSYLTRLPSTPGDRTRWTWSSWIKLGSLSAVNKHLFETASSPEYTGLYTTTTGALEFRGYAGGFNWRLTSSQVLLDPAGWYHVVVNFNSPETTTSNRLAMYINGVEITDFSASTYPSTQNQESNWNNKVNHYIGSFTGSSNHWDGYMAEIYSIDGQALTASDFGEFDQTTGIWKPKAYAGTYSNGIFYSNYGVSVNSDPTLRLWTHAFDGSDGSYVTGDGTTNNQSLWTYPNGIAVNTSLRLRLSGGTNSFVYVNGSQVAGVTDTGVGSPTWYTVTGVSNLTSIGVGNNGSTWSALHQIEVDGTVLTDATVGRNSFHLNFSNGVDDQSGTSNNWTPNNLLPTNYTGTVQFGAASPSDNTFDSPSTSITKDTTGYSYSTVSNPKKDTGDANNATVLKTLDGTQIYWKFEDDGLTSNRYIHVSNNGINWTSPGSVYGTSTGAKVVGPSSWVVWAGGANTDVTTVSWQGDVFKDSPTSDDASADTGLGGELVSNYATLNPLRNGQTLSNGNLDVVGTTSWQRSVSTIAMSSGKWYWEYEITASNEHIVGVGPLDMQLSGNLGAGSPPGSGYATELGSVNGTGANSSWNNTGGSTAGDFIGIAFDADAGNMYVYKNGTALNSGAASHTGLTNGPYEAVFSLNGNTRSGRVNFGATPFKHQAPTGYKCLCSANLGLTDVANDPTSAMDTVVYNSVGTGGGLSVSSLKFKPDLLIFKDMDGGNNWVWFDTLRTPGYKLDSTGQNGQADFTSYFTSIDSNGFTIPAGNHDINRDTNQIAAYCWNAGELAVSSDTTNYDQSQEWSANVTFGFGGERIYDGSTVTYANTSDTGGATLFSGTMTIPAGQDLEIRTQNGGASSISVDGNAVSTASGQVTTTLVSGPATVNTITAPTGFNIYYFTIGGKRLIDPGVIPIGSLNSLVYDQSQTWSNNVTNPSGAYGAASNAFDGDLSTFASPSNGNPMTYTNPSASDTVISTFEIYTDIYDKSGATLELNSTDILPQVTTGAHWHTITGFSGQNFSNLKWEANPSNYEVRIHQVKVNGKILVDSGVSVNDAPSLPAKVKRSSEYGFSMVKYFGDGSASASVPHNLGKEPTFYIEKNTSATGNWGVLTTVIDGSMDFLYLQSNNSAKGDASQEPFTKQTFNVQTSAVQNILNNEYIQYIWTDVPGFSKAGKYTGSGGQQFVYLGFRPAWLLIKRYSDTTVGEWSVYSSERSPYNEVQRKVWFNNVSAEENHPNNSLAFTANGFIVDPGSDSPNVQYTNNSGVGYLYLAFAGNPINLAF